MFNYKLSLSILAVAVAGVAPANLLTNGNFATGDFTGWTVDGAGEPWTTVNAAPFFAGLPGAGTYSAAFGNVVALGSISQSISTVTGQAYNLSFYFATNNTGDIPTFQLYASQNGNNLFSYSSTNIAAASLKSYSFVATSTSTEIKFSGMAPYNYLAINNVVFEAVPEPATLVIVGTGCLALLRRRRK